MSDENNVPGTFLGVADIVVGFILVFISILVLINLFPAKKRYYRSCKANLDQIGKSMKLYTIDFGRGVRYPAENGSGFLATLYRENILVESSVYLCPTTPDDNYEVDIATIRGEGNGDGPISFTGRKNRSQALYPGIFMPHRGTTITTISGDDWNDGEVENHQNGELVVFLFLDGHSDHIKSRGANFDNYSFNFDPLAN